jgi:hypothetical protein
MVKRLSITSRRSNSNSLSQTARYGRRRRVSKATPLQPSESVMSTKV